MRKKVVVGVGEEEEGEAIVGEASVVSSSLVFAPGELSVESELVRMMEGGQRCDLLTQRGSSEVYH